MSQENSNDLEVPTLDGLDQRRSTSVIFYLDFDARGLFEEFVDFMNVTIFTSFPKSRDHVGGRMGRPGTPARQARLHKGNAGACVLLIDCFTVDKGGNYV